MQPEGHGSAARGSLLKTQISFLSFHYLSHVNSYMELLGKRTFIFSMPGKASRSGCACVSSVILGFILPQARALFPSSEIHGRLLSNSVFSVQNAPQHNTHLYANTCTYQYTYINIHVQTCQHVCTSLHRHKCAYTRRFMCIHHEHT